jgi:hypothetical protein
MFDWLIMFNIRRPFRLLITCFDPLFQISEDFSQGKDPFNFFLKTNNPKNLTSKKPNCGKHGFTFLLPSKGTLDLFHVHLIRLGNQQFSFNKLFVGSILPIIIWIIFKLLSSSTFWSTKPLSNSIDGCKW